jgi:nucleoside-diphosphate-sugar epimerase
MNVLVTGARGFIGTWVVKELESRGHKYIDFLGDVRNNNSFPNKPVEVVIHLAALITHRQQYDKNDLYDINVQGTKNILEAYPAAKMVYISTTDVTREKLSEYAMTKLEAEKIVEQRGNYVIIRLPSVFGPQQRQNKLIPLLFKKYYQGTACSINNNDLREYVFIEDVAKQIIDSIHKIGIVSVEGIKIANLDLDTMVRAICEGKTISSLTSKEKYFFSCLEKCLITYRAKPK